jgi:hypothetical protein
MSRAQAHPLNPLETKLPLNNKKPLADRFAIFMYGNPWHLLVFDSLGLFVTFEVEGKRGVY